MEDQIVKHKKFVEENIGSKIKVYFEKLIEIITK